MLVTVLGNGDIAGNKTGRDPHSNGVYLRWRETEDKKKAIYDVLGNHKD